MPKRYEISARFLVFATVSVIAKDEQDARDRVAKGGGWFSDVDFEKHTAELDSLESIKMVEDLDPEPEEEESDETPDH